ncbi:A-kinase anchor protein SPHKAP SPHK1-interactor and AKAP domain-containing protein [Channa argus]|uniref:A-kinase anchor protein SPHKAP SPHK1-interactor and AKAP domain-containing protein n=1 Tax=Channa argus TaxID=215402 RepID=A0A6G1PRW3_CHAAH|nr:A-kinase anchor protein SPHKAP SPHK1-interactor and AKAP domain-containing protein [Channa argus]
MCGNRGNDGKRRGKRIEGRGGQTSHVFSLRLIYAGLLRPRSELGGQTRRAGSALLLLLLLLLIAVSNDQSFSSHGAAGWDSFSVRVGDAHWDRRVSRNFQSSAMFEASESVEVEGGSTDSTVASSISACKKVLCSNSVLDSSEYWLGNDKALCRLGLLDDDTEGSYTMVTGIAVIQQRAPFSHAHVAPLKCEQPHAELNVPENPRHQLYYLGQGVDKTQTTASLSDFDVTNCSSDSQISVGLLSGLHGQSIKREPTINDTV